MDRSFHLITHTVSCRKHRYTRELLAHGCGQIYNCILYSVYYTVYIIKCILYTLCQNLTQPKNLLIIISKKSDNDNSTKNLDQGQNEREVEIPGSCSYCRWHNTGAVNDNCKVGSLQTFPRKFVIGKRGAFDAIKNIMKYCEQQLK